MSYCYLVVLKQTNPIKSALLSTSTTRHQNCLGLTREIVKRKEIQDRMNLQVIFTSLCWFTYYQCTFYTLIIFYLQQKWYYIEEYSYKKFFFLFTIMKWCSFLSIDKSEKPSFWMTEVIPCIDFNVTTWF